MRCCSRCLRSSHSRARRRALAGHCLSVEASQRPSPTTSRQARRSVKARALRCWRSAPNGKGSRSHTRQSSCTPSGCVVIQYRAGASMSGRPHTVQWPARRLGIDRGSRISILYICPVSGASAATDLGGPGANTTMLTAAAVMLSPRGDAFVACTLDHHDCGGDDHHLLARQRAGRSRALRMIPLTAVTAPPRAIRSPKCARARCAPPAPRRRSRAATSASTPRATRCTAATAPPSAQ